MSENFEDIMLRNMQHNDQYIRKVLPYIKDEYFANNAEKLYFNVLKQYYEKYGKAPTQDAMFIELQNLKVTDQEIDQLGDLYDKVTMNKNVLTDESWLLQKTEEFCQEKALANALMKSIQISADENNSGDLSKTAIPSILSDALSISFDTEIGHDYIDDADSRFDYYNQKVHKVLSHLDMLNMITNGGVEIKTVNCIAGGTGAGKSMLLCDLAANYMRMGKNVLYITLELAEEKVAERIDANLMGVDMSEVSRMDRTTFDKRMSNVKTKVMGKLKIKEYPTSSAHIGHFKHLIAEYKQKKNFTPDIIIVDYLNICTSARFKDRSNSYGYVKAICEELRKLAVEEKVVLWTATQLNRNGIDNSDVELKDISESMGGPMTFDLLLALVTNDDLAKMKQVLFIQLKNRYGDVFVNKKFTVGVDRGKMKFYDLNNSTPDFSTVQPTPLTQKQKGNFANVKV